MRTSSVTTLLEAQNYFHAHIHARASRPDPTPPEFCNFQDSTLCLRLQVQVVLPWAKQTHTGESFVKLEVDLAMYS